MHSRTQPAVPTLGSLAFCLLGLASPGWTEKAPVAARLEALAWSDSILPPPFVPGDDPRSLRGFPPDSIPDPSRSKLQANWIDQPPVLDGRLDDWPVVRWHDLRGGSALVRGRWNGTDDATLQFAVLWTSQGLVLGATLRDDSLVTGGANAGRIESVLLYVGSSSTLVQRYWIGSERSVRLWADGRLEAWTRWRNRRAILFDPHALGARGAAVAEGEPGKRGTVTFELFVPWDLLFPALPHDSAALLVNVLVEDVDGGADKLFAWVARPGLVKVPGKIAAPKPGPVPGWAALVFGGGPPAGTWLVSTGSRHVEPGYVHEWSLCRWGETTAMKPVVVAVGTHDKRPLEVELRRTPAMLRYRAPDTAREPWARARKFELDVGPKGGTPWRHELLFWAPTQAGLGAAQAAIAATPRGFPRATDIGVRLQKVEALVERLGDWRTARHSDRGALASRAAAWAGLENRLLECQVLRDMAFGAPDAAEQDKLLGALWPQRSASGIPIGVTFQRGTRAGCDGSVQPYGVYVSRAAASSTAAPVLVVLHDVDEDEMAPLMDSKLLAAVEARGWIALSPYGRGNSGFQLAGERDVLDALAQVRADLPADPTRLYVTGVGMGGTGAWLLSLRHAELFAAAAIVSGYGDMDQPGLVQALAYLPDELFFYETANPARLVRPGLQTAYRVVHADGDPLISVVHARVMAERLREQGVVHEVVLPPTQETGRTLFAGELEANLNYLAAHRRSSPGQSEAGWFGGVGGPVATVFARAPFAVVRGTRALSGPPARAGVDSSALRTVTGPDADARCADHVTQEWQSLFAARIPVRDDTQVDAALQDTTNLVLVGDPRTNRVLAAVANQLPVHYDGDRFEVQGKWWDSRDAGILYATAHPTRPDRTLVVLSGMAERLGGFRKSLLKLGADYIVVNDKQEVLAVGHFRGFGGRQLPGDGR